MLPLALRFAEKITTALFGAGATAVAVHSAKTPQISNPIARYHPESTTHDALLRPRDLEIIPPPERPDALTAPHTATLSLSSTRNTAPSKSFSEATLSTMSQDTGILSTSTSAGAQHLLQNLPTELYPPQLNYTPVRPADTNGVQIGIVPMDTFPKNFGVLPGNPSTHVMHDHLLPGFKSVRPIDADNIAIYVPAPNLNRTPAMGGREITTQATPTILLSESNGNRTTETELSKLLRDINEQHTAATREVRKQLQPIKEDQLITVDLERMKEISAAIADIEVLHGRYTSEVDARMTGSVTPERLEQTFAVLVDLERALAQHKKTHGMWYEEVYKTYQVASRNKISEWYVSRPSERAKVLEAQLETMMHDAEEAYEKVSRQHAQVTKLRQAIQEKYANLPGK